MLVWEFINQLDSSQLWMPTTGVLTAGIRSTAKDSCCPMDGKQWIHTYPPSTYIVDRRRACQHEHSQWCPCPTAWLSSAPHPSARTTFVRTPHRRLPMFHSVRALYSMGKKQKVSKIVVSKKIAIRCSTWRSSIPNRQIECRRTRQRGWLIIGLSCFNSTINHHRSLDPRTDN